MMFRLTNWIRSNGLFLVVFIILSAIIFQGFTYIYHYPYGIHRWKQSMHFSMIQNFVDGSATFFHPAINGLFNPNHTGTLIMEFPIFHWLTALLIKVFPWLTPAIFTWILFLLTALGIFYIYKLAYMVIGNKPLAVFASMFVFSVPIILYYGTNYLVDVPALLFAIDAIYFLEKNQKNPQVKNLIAAGVFLALAGLLRLPVLIPFFSYLGIRIIFKKNIREFAWMIPSFILIFLWYFYESRYNTYYVSKPPADTITSFSSDHINQVWNDFYTYLFPELGLLHGCLIFYLVIAAILIWRRKAVSRFWFSVMMVNLLGSAAYFLLWFGLFSNHDYYMIPLVSNVAFIWINIFIAIKDLRRQKVIQGIVIVALIFSVAGSMYNYRVRLGKERWSAMKLLFKKDNIEMLEYVAWDDKLKLGNLYLLSPYRGYDLLAEYGISKNDTLICDFDVCPTYALSLLQRKGFSAYCSDFSSIQGYKNYVDAGAHYLICDTNDIYLSDTNEIKLLKSNKVFSLGNFEVYDIRQLK